MKVLIALAAVALVAAGWYGGPLVHPTSAPSARPLAWRPVTTAIGPRAFSATQLRAEALALGEPVYWVGPATGNRYEFTRTSSGYVFVRYLPQGFRAGAPGAHFLVIATYPFPYAYKSLRHLAHERGVVGPGGSFIYPRPDDSRSVLMAFPRVPYEIEVYAPRSALALQVVESGLVRPVG